MLKNMGEAEYVADYILGNGNKEDRSFVLWDIQRFLLKELADESQLESHEHVELSEFLTD